jgi:hypothetical protein
LTIAEPSSTESEAPAATLSERAALLRRLESSVELHRSARSREFLHYIGERALAGANYVSEQEIGIEVFGRSRDYDTSIDNIVRVNATHLRKRIEVYFATEGTTEPLIVQLPRGSYLPVFELRPVESKPAFADAGTDAHTPLSADSASDKSASSTTRSSTLVWVLGATTVVVSLLCLFFALQARRARTAFADNSIAALSPYWVWFFSDGRPTDLVLADTSFAMTQDMLDRPISLKQYTDRNFMSHVDALTSDPALKRDLQIMSSRTYGSFAEFRFADQLMRGMPANREISLQSAREFSA